MLKGGLRTGAALTVMFGASLARAAVPAAASGADLCSPLLQSAQMLKGKPLAARGLVELRNALFSPRLQVPAAAPVDPGLTRRAQRLFPPAADTNGLQLQSLAPGVWRASIEEGPAACSHERFFRQTAAGRLQSIPPPAAFGDLCWSSGRSVGEVGGAPALVELDQGLGGASLALELTPWRSEFGPACRLQLRLKRHFEVRERRCADAALCKVGEPVARALAESFISGLEPTGLAAASTPSSSADAHPDAAGASAAPLSGAEAIEHRPELPAFGQPFAAEFVDFSAVEARRPVRIGREAVVIRLGLASVGGRPLGEPLVVIYRRTKKGLEPKASFVLEPAFAELISAEATPTGPFVAAPAP